MEKIKQFLDSDKGKDILTIIILILVGLGSFELGRLSKNEDTSGVKILNMDSTDFYKQGLKTNKINNNNSEKVQGVTFDSSGKSFFASSRGSKYYSLDCSAGKTIKQENRTYFSTSSEAEKAGYTLSSSCN